jgi:hypothetical protein
MNTCEGWTKCDQYPYNGVYYYKTDNTKRWKFTILADVDWETEKTVWRPSIAFYGFSSNYPNDYGFEHCLTFTTKEDAMDACDAEWQKLITEDEEVKELLKDFQ